VAKYYVAFASSAEKELKTLPSQLIARLIPRLEDLGPILVRLAATSSGAVMASGAFVPAVYTINDAKSLVEVTRIRHRSEVYER
jgi:mRNA-degrading endonuclease RelE of RelBE toxin-antitoxin system